MIKSELIEMLAEKLTHLPEKDVELAVKEILEHMTQTLQKGDRIEIRGFGSFLCITELPELGATLKLATRWNWTVNTFLIFGLVKNCEKK